MPHDRLRPRRAPDRRAGLRPPAYVDEFDDVHRPGLSARRRRRGAGRPTSASPAASSRRERPRVATSAALRRACRSSSPSAASAAWPASAPAPTARSSRRSCPRRTWTPRDRRSPRRTPSRCASAADLRAQFVRDRRSTPTVPERNGIEPAAFGLFIDPTHCKGCGECVEVCAALGHDALLMTDKVDGEPDRDVDDRPGRAGDALPPVAAADARGLPQRQGAGRPHARRARLRLRRRGRLVRRLRRGDRDPDDGRRDAPGARARVDGHRRRDRLQHGLRRTYPFNPYLVPWTNSLFENAPAVALGIRARWDQAGHPERRLWVIGGDGAMYDIGFQALSRMVASGADIKVLVLDTQVYSNTGGQASTASFGGQVTKLSAFGAAHPRPARAPQGARPDPDGPRRGVRGPDDAGPLNHFYRSSSRRTSSPARRW